MFTLMSTYFISHMQLGHVLVQLGHVLLCSLLSGGERRECISAVDGRGDDASQAEGAGDDHQDE